MKLVRYFHIFLSALRLRNVRKKIKFLGKNVIIHKFHDISGSGVIIEDNVAIGVGAWIATKQIDEDNKPLLVIGNGSVIGRYNEIYATKQIILEKNVLTAERVYISDNLHGYENINIPIKSQPIKQNGSVKIGEGSWIGVGVAILGANIGKHCVIGSNAVVTHDIPDYSVAVGIPAKVIKKYNHETHNWINCNNF